MKLLVFAASHRKASLNRRLAQLAAKQLESLGATVDYADYSTFDMPPYNDEEYTSSGVPIIAQSFAQRAKSVDGIIICTPEYNWSFPGSLKNIIDWTSRLSPAPLAGKTALIMSATPGSRGGIVGLAHLKTVLEAIQMFVYPKVFPLPKADSELDEKGLTSAKQQQLFISLAADYSDFTRKLMQQ